MAEDQTSDGQTPRDDLDALLDFLLGFASEQLSASGEFYPFAAAMTLDGKVKPVAVQMDEEMPESEAVVTLLVAALAGQAAAKEIRASGICVNAIVSLEGEDAEGSYGALVHLEHLHDDPLDVVLPYELHGDHIHTGELIAAPGATRVFLADET